ncbi:alpha-N-arabinofuranosidase [Sandaracinomonas limnophila]|uniref:Alpha-N-arabinofuranosidase n=2 Tax=Sandaracinomonas limnophila TaxID=1862386 RepID=A0A437PXN1_9BACT|nr:alpha-N-arabinofuranosidase [Sandaracinomonas limnophila]
MLNTNLFRMKRLFICFSMLSFAAFSQVKKEPISQPLITDQYSADPSAHLFKGKIYIYPSHDIDAGIKEDDLGSHFGMRDYHVFSQENPSAAITDHGVALKLEDIPWAGKMLWAPDAAEKNGKYYLYFPAKDKEGIFRIGVASAIKPEGPFNAEPSYMKGTYSIDPAVFKDKDGSYYIYIGGIWGGQLQHWKSGKHEFDEKQPADNQPALMPKMAKLSADMKSIESPLQNVQILDKEGKLLLSGDHNRRFFEAPFVHFYNGKYYFSYSTGDTHFIAYATGDSPKGPFTYQGVILNPVQGWTNHHSIIEQNGKWYLYYHDVQMSGKTHLRNIKVTELKYNTDGTIQTITAYK